MVLTARQEASRRQAEQRREERHARGLRSAGRPRSSTEGPPTAPNPVGRPRICHDPIVEWMKREERENPGAPRNGMNAFLGLTGTMQSALQEYAEFLHKNGYRPPFRCGWVPETCGEVAAYRTAKLRIEEEYLAGLPPVRGGDVLCEEEDREAAEEAAREADKEMPKEAEDVIMETDEPQPSPPMAGEQYKAYVKRVSGELGISYVAAQEAVKASGLWKKA